LIKSFKHDGLERFFTTGSKAGIIPNHAGKLRVLLGLVNTATKPSDLATANVGLHPLKGTLQGHWAVR
jgi:toxin HigB-1